MPGVRNWVWRFRGCGLFSMQNEPLRGNCPRCCLSTQLKIGNISGNWPCFYMETLNTKSCSFPSTEAVMRSLVVPPGSKPKSLSTVYKSSTLNFSPYSRFAGPFK